MGDYILNSGDSAAAVIAETLIRSIPRLLGNVQCIHDDSHCLPYLEAPQYTQPVQFNNKKVPKFIDLEIIKKYHVISLNSRYQKHCFIDLIFWV